MTRRKQLAVALGVLPVACFAPDAPVETEAAAATSGESMTTGGSSSGTPSGNASVSTGIDGDESTSSGAPTPTTDGDTSSGGVVDSECETTDDCNAGLVCLDQTCSLCTAADDGDSVCAEGYPDQPVCGDDGRCAACVAESCSGRTPVCDAAVGCVACTEHAECPDSACHLGGPDVGACFDTADVVEVQAPGAFAELLGEVGPGQDRVFVLGAATYTFPVSGVSVYDIDGEREVAFLGNGSTVLQGNVGANAAFFGATDDESQVYLSRLEWNGTSGESGDIPILLVGPAAELWVDDSTTRGTLQLADGAAHLRRSNLFDGVGTPFGYPDASLQGSGSLYLENASIEPGLEQIRFVGILDVRYSTVVIEGDFMCGAATDGVVRNSVVLTGGSISEECEGAAWSGSAVNTAGFGTSVPPFESGWFAASAAVRFRLSPQGAEVFGDVAQWEEGDPSLDAEGDERPTMGPSAAGVDEP